MRRDGDAVWVVRLCQLAGLSRQAYYQGCRARRRREIDEEAIVEQVRVERKLHPKIGARKLQVMLRPVLEEMGISVGRDRLFRLLRARGLLVKRSRRRAKTTQSGHLFHVYPNLIRHIEPMMPNQVWVSDLTYLRTDEGFLYLSLIMDAYSRKVVGQVVSDTLEAEGCLRALKTALDALPAGARPVHHSDRGLQYCSKEYVRLLGHYGCPISMTEVNHCYENAKAERLNGILKGEYALGETFRDKRQATRAAQEAVVLYNRFRPHTCLKWKTPEEVHAVAA